MLSDLLVMLLLLTMVLFIVYHFYVDYSNWSNTGNTFAEGMTNNKQCAANFGTTTPSDGSNSGTVAAQYVCPQELPVCNDYKFQVKWGNCIAAPSNEGTCERNDPSKITAVSYNGGSFPWDSSKSQEWNVNNHCRKQCISGN